ncbi:MAG: PEGA domain-containing protein [Deltaproteobacteria bacterium]
MMNQLVRRNAFLLGASVFALASTPAFAAGEAAAESAEPSTNGTAEAAAEKAAEAEKAGEKVLVLPYQPIFRSVEQRKAATATNLLNKELQQKDGIVVIRGAVANGAKATGPTLDEATAAQKEATEAEARRDIRAAIAARQKVIAAMEKNAGAIEEVDDFIRAHHDLARALMWAADDAEAKKVMDVAARMRPSFALPAKEFSRHYRRWFRAAATAAVKDKRGELFVKSGLPGAKVFLDGREMDVAPVVLEKTVPGKHLLTAVVEGVPQYGGIVDVKAGKKTTFTVSFGGSVGGDSVGDVTDAIAANKLDKSAVKSAVQAGKVAGAKYVVAGGMAKDEDHFNMHTLVVDVGTGNVQHLSVVAFDLELLTAEADVFQIVGAIDESVRSFKGASAVATIEKRIRSQSTINEVDASPAKVARRAGPKRKRAKVRGPIKPLQGGTIIIKDEEE